MKDKIMKQLYNVWDELTYGVRWLCLCPSPAKRLVTVSVLVVFFGGLNIWFVVSSIYNIGKSDAKKEFLELRHIQTLELQHKNDTINILNQKKYEYE
jgi:hypothetical protein